MLVTIRTISGPAYSVEAAETETVAALKEKVVAAAPEGVCFNKDSLLLIYKGKILSDTETVKDANIEEGGFCVAMQRKGAAAPKETKPAGQPSTAPETAPVETAPTQEAPTTQGDTGAVQPEEAAPQVVGSYEEAASALLTGSQLEQNITQICDMGFERSQVVRAMHAAFNNPDRAVEYLMNGIPQMEVPAEQPPATGTPQAVGGTPVTAATPAQGQGQGQGQGPNTQPLNMFGAPVPAAGTGGAAAGGGGGGGGALDYLRNNPQFNLIRHLVAQNPHVLQPMIQELGRNNPELLRHINEHQQEFLALLTEEPPAQVTEAAEGLMQLAGQGGIAGGDPVVPTLTMTAEEAEAIERLQSLGFDRDRCVEAFFICDKNEEIAANYLLEHADDA